MDDLWSQRSEFPEQISDIHHKARMKVSRHLLEASGKRILRGRIISDFANLGTRLAGVRQIKIIPLLCACLQMIAKKRQIFGTNNRSESCQSVHDLALRPARL
jgi:hypothetical protein